MELVREVFPYIKFRLTPIWGSWRRKWSWNQISGLVGRRPFQSELTEHQFDVWINPKNDDHYSWPLQCLPQPVSGLHLLHEPELGVGTELSLALLLLVPLLLSLVVLTVFAPLFVKVTCPHSDQWSQPATLQILLSHSTIIVESRILHLEFIESPSKTFKPNINSWRIN